MKHFKVDSFKTDQFKMDPLSKLSISRWIFSNGSKFTISKSIKMNKLKWTVSNGPKCINSKWINLKWIILKWLFQNGIFQMDHFQWWNKKSLHSMIEIRIFWENSKLSRLQTNGPTVLGPPNSFEAFDGNSLRVSVLTYSLTMFLF